MPLTGFVLRHLKTGKAWSRSLLRWTDSNPTFFFVGDDTEKLGEPPFKHTQWEEQQIPEYGAEIFTELESLAKPEEVSQ